MALAGAARAAWYRFHTSFDVCVSWLERERWQKPVSLRTAVNSPYHDADPSLSGDGRTLYFTTSRPGGLGGFELYRSTAVPEP